MKKRFAIHDIWGVASYGLIIYPTFETAQKEAEKFAASQPGYPVQIYELAGESLVPMSRATTRRAKKK